ncbi:ATPase family AAA domain-containing protein 1-B isoform X1 [Cucumis melo var. makuwa]|uniref:ATPase family AAA domain-containing protein 1-B isoform X1 n=1 Tax=Cucumis melo var. makuwa TaxID=1194695 RepID=A0A5D3BSD4_CUCMM|nr:ATPase family AAA domain-containing protein 1-B isoform X1 [Cucumis melo var. makuwa]
MSKFTILFPKFPLFPQRLHDLLFHLLASPHSSQVAAEDWLGSSAAEDLLHSSTIEDLLGSSAAQGMLCLSAIVQNRSRKVVFVRRSSEIYHAPFQLATEHFGHQPEHLKPELLSNGREPCFRYPIIVVGMFGVGAMEIAYAELKRFQGVDDNNRETLSLELSKSVGLGGG